MRAGRMDRLVTLEYKTVSQNDHGEEIETWTAKATIWAGKKDFRGTEFFGAQQVNAEATGIFIIRYRDDVNTEDYRLTYEGDTYDIKAVAELGRRAGLELMVEARVE